jgi:hypothetical protein
VTKLAVLRASQIRNWWCYGLLPTKPFGTRELPTFNPSLAALPLVSLPRWLSSLSWIRSVGDFAVLMGRAGGLEAICDREIDFSDYRVYQDLEEATTDNVLAWQDFTELKSRYV